MKNNPRYLKFSAINPAWFLQCQEVPCSGEGFIAQQMGDKSEWRSIRESIIACVPRFQVSKENEKTYLPDLTFLPINPARFLRYLDVPCSGEGFIAPFERIVNKSEWRIIREPDRADPPGRYGRALNVTCCQNSLEPA